MSTGVTVADAVVEQFTEFKKSSNKITFVIFKIADGKDGQIVTEHTSGEGEVFDTFASLLPEDDCRYAIYQVDFTTNDGRPANKLVSITWAPDTARVKQKMIYAGSKDALTRVFVGVAVKINATDRSELTMDIIVEACKKFA
ncbi:putative actin-depolymerizing factor [Ochromonadaceae sp. CCMP2298]|nr:putative actin-depolymerizing factor [Ochromonadaceae sp. CCMP2298]|mmetsp:Transcript_19033/g.42415  ORF Transcript_19033/g.42415 Transcript_19033/m.42415 type:complete len:142 (+) Transcript_19033:51-476(+)